MRLIDNLDNQIYLLKLHSNASDWFGKLHSNASDWFGYSVRSEVLAAEAKKAATKLGFIQSGGMAE